jgi:hypothetical protein
MKRVLALVLGLWLAIGGVGQAAVAVDSQESASTAHHSNTSPLTWTFNNVAGTVMFIGVVVTDGTGSTTTLGAVSYNSVAATQVGSSLVTWDGTASRAAIYRLLSPATGNNTVSVAATSTGGGGLDIIAGAISFTGNDTTTPAGTAVTATGNNGTATVNVTSTTNGNYVISVVGTGTSVTSATSPTLLSAKLNVSGGTAGDNLGLGDQATSGGTVAAKFAVSSDLWGISAVEVKAAATSSGCPMTRSRMGVGC